MARPARAVLEYRHYPLPPRFPIQLLRGEHWRISAVPCGVLQCHHALEIGLCESDGGTLGCQGEERRFCAGDVTVIAGDVPHTTWSDPGAASKWSYLHLDLQALLRPFCPAALPDPSVFQDIVQGHYFILPGAQYPAVWQTVAAAMDEMERRLPYCQLKVRTLLLSLGIELLRISAEPGRAARAGVIPVSPALEYIEAHYMEDFPIEKLAALCGLSQSHFRKLFRELLGVGPLEYLNRTRIRKACSLMRMSEASILSISGQVGFASLSSFNRHFLAQLGVAPSRWRQSEGNDPRTAVLKYGGWLAPPDDTDSTGGS